MPQDEISNLDIDKVAGVVLTSGSIDGRRQAEVKIQDLTHLILVLRSHPTANETVPIRTLPVENVPL